MLLPSAVDALEDDEGAARRLQAATADMVKKRLKIVLAAAQRELCACCGMREFEKVERLLVSYRPLAYAGLTCQKS